MAPWGDVAYFVTGRIAQSLTWSSYLHVLSGVRGGGVKRETMYSTVECIRVSRKCLACLFWGGLASPLLFVASKHTNVNFCLAVCRWLDRWAAFDMMTLCRIMSSVRKGVGEAGYDVQWGPQNRIRINERAEVSEYVGFV